MDLKIKPSYAITDPDKLTHDQFIKLSCSAVSSIFDMTAVDAQPAADAVNFNNMVYVPFTYLRAVVIRDNVSCITRHTDFTVHVQAPQTKAEIQHRMTAFSNTPVWIAKLDDPVNQWLVWPNYVRSLIFAERSAIMRFTPAHMLSQIGAQRVLIVSMLEAGLQDAVADAGLNCTTTPDVTLVDISAIGYATATAQLWLQNVTYIECVQLLGGIADMVAHTFGDTRVDVKRVSIEPYSDGKVLKFELQVFTQSFI